ncbi:uncharacterized protein [Dysidea avara]|uniref:uncharacterized protein isoform X2 n=1 Tax=Dysidea avara TaxID=196820 RepID=UPI00331695AF
MASSSTDNSIDVEIDEPLNPSYHKCPELFYPKQFVSIKSPHKLIQHNVVDTIYHGTHLQQATEICGRSAQPLMYTFKATEKKWRTLGKGYTEANCSYLIKPNESAALPIGSNEVFGPFLWFGTDKSETENYGPWCFELDFPSVLEAYHMCRQNRQICSRVGGTLIYKHEITHVVIICCEEDKECQQYPLIQANNSRYFVLPISDDNYGMAIASNSVNIAPRHEHVTLAFYLPGDSKLRLPVTAGEISENKHQYCVKSEGGVCQHK